MVTSNLATVCHVNESNLSVPKKGFLTLKTLANTKLGHSKKFLESVQAS